MALDSLDPRVNRLDLPESWGTTFSKEALDQLPTFEVFVQAKEGRPFQHEGIVHAADEEIAFVFAKEQFSRRNSCSGLWVIRTRNIKVTPFTDNNRSVYEEIRETPEAGGKLQPFELFHLLKRGKQHKHAGTLEAYGYKDAILKAKSTLNLPERPVYNIWVARSEYFYRSGASDKNIWDTLPEKKFRDAVDYKVGDMLKQFKSRQQS